MTYKAVEIIGDRAMAVEFATQEDFQRWHQEMSAIKEHIARINASSDEAQYPAWLARVEVFRHQYGNTLVPPDIKDAVRDIQEALNLTLSDFS